MRSEYKHFLAWNSSYSQCVRRENVDPVIGSKNMTRQTISSGDATFVDCDFKNISTGNSSRVNGGAILFTSSGFLNVTLCKFYLCFSSWCGGAISSRSSGKKLYVISSSFDSCTAEDSSGCIDFYYVSTFSMKNTNCSNSSAKHIGGGILIEHNDNQGLVENSIFFCCRKNTTQYSGGGSVGFFRNGTAILSDCSLCGGYSEYNGGGMCWSNSTGDNDSPIMFCFFSNNTAMNLGHDVYVVQGWTNINDTSFVHCRSSTSANSNRVVKGETGYDNWIPKIFFNPVFVNSMEGLDHMACGLVRAGDEYGRRCKTIEYGMSVLDAEGSSNEVIIEVGDYEENKIDVGKMKVSFEGKDKTQVIVHNGSPNGESLVAIGAGVGSFRKIKFICMENPSSHLMEVLVEEGMLKLVECVITSLRNDESCALSASLMIVQMGSVILDSVEISEISFSSVPVFEIRGEHSLFFQMNDVEVEGISRMSGDGSVICGNLVNGMKMNISGGMMRNCVCEDGCGGGMWIQLNEGSQMEIGNVSSESADENVDYVTFSNCCCLGNTNGVGGFGGAIYLDVCDENSAFCIHYASFENCQAEKGNNIFVNAQCLRDVVSHITFGFEHEGMSDRDLLGFEDRCREECAPLLPFMMEAGDVGFVGGEKSLDFSRCGMEQYPCSSIKRVVEVWYGAVSRTIRIKNGFVLCEEVVMESQFWNVTGTIGDTAVEVVAPTLQFDSKCLIKISSAALLKDMCFSLPSALSPASSFILSSSNALSVSDCSIESAIKNSLNEIEFCVFHIDGGVLHMTGFSNKGSINTLSDPIIRCGGESSAEFSNCVLTGISRRNGGGSCLERSCAKKESKNSDTYIVDVIIITNSTFSECGVEEKDGCGGGMKISIGKDEEVVINGSTTFDGCKTENETDSNGRGGGMMISVGSGGGIKMKGVEFKNCEVSSSEEEIRGKGFGGGIFVSLDERIEIFSLESMTFVGCNAWKGKNLFVSGWDLSVIVNKDNFKWEMSDEELGSLDELCGWERASTGETYVIPLVVYLWDNWSGNGYVSGDGGGDFSGCGNSEAPCSSIDHLVSLRCSPLGREETKIAIRNSGKLSNSISLLSSSSSLSERLSVWIEGEERKATIKVTEGDGSEDGMIQSNVSLSIARIAFSLPNELLHHSSLIHSLSSTASALSVFCCSFACGEATKETNYCLMKADGGSVAIEDCTLSQFSLAKGFVEFTEGVMMVDVVNVSISNTTISGCSLISLSQPSPTNVLLSNERVNTRQTVRVNGSSFTNITCTENRACALSVGSFSAGVECVVEGCELRKCMSETSEEGGGMRVLLKRGESELKVSGCTFGMCVCSTANGRGGGMMIDALDPNRVPDQMPASPLGLIMENIRFMMNDAHVGKDVFIRCNSIDSQVNETLFSLDFSQEALKLNNSVWGSDASGGGDVDLIPLITFYFAVQVFANVGGTDSRQCGAQTNPCKSISCSASHIQRGVANMIFVDGEGDIGGECVIGDLCVKSVKKTKATIHFNATIQEMGNERSVIVFVNECVAERCAFEFGEMFEANHRHILKVQNGTTELRECEFSSSSFGYLIKNSIMAVEGGELEMDKCEMVRMKTSVPLIEFIGESKAFISETKILNILSEGNAIEVGGRARVQMKELDAQNITLLRSGSAVKMQNLEENVVLSNCSFGKCLSEKEKGSIVSVVNCSDVCFDLCIFLGVVDEDRKMESSENGRIEEICRWNGSVIDFSSSSAVVRDTTIFNSSKGGMTARGGSVTIEKGEFFGNNPFIAKYPSLCRNIICSDSASLTISSLKGGDGVMPNSSLWILDDGCSLEGIAGERESPFFIPKL
eukprot:MONOS_12163.1-p1 / transcript=MONOS_12163.1 / gene=MONOS_12163 / organism=Monocercomonoides_exilis_PA203 / gene_product=unspecified product / transcript_product=unspecified product / location=Mono_scaffold00655:1427-6922(-) / protein_length=1832 / sequence_SO=supercontig / SO=protein_coding / is_pseudo=false